MELLANTALLAMQTLTCAYHIWRSLHRLEMSVNHSLVNLPGKSDALRLQNGEQGNCSARVTWPWAPAWPRGQQGVSVTFLPGSAGLFHHARATAKIRPRECQVCVQAARMMFYRETIALEVPVQYCTVCALS